jgi:hypothetical protein
MLRDVTPCEIQLIISQGKRDCLGEFRCEDVDWLRLTQERDKWRGFANMVMNLVVEICRLAERLFGVLENNSDGI